MLSLKENGDILEQKYYNDIIIKFIQYEELWKIFVGNDGKAQIIKSGDQGIDNFRKDIAQHSYTIYESLVCLFRIANASNEIKSIDDYLDENNNFLLFQTHCGRIRDCVHKIGIKLKLGNLEENLIDFYKCRNHVLHGKKIPFTIIEEMFVLPIVEGKEFNENYWKDDLLWEEVQKTEKEFVKDIYSELFDKMIFCLNSIYSKVLSKIKNSPEYNSTIEMMNNYKPNDNMYKTEAYLTDNHFMSERILNSASGSISNIQSHA
jgi:hypothetical protein